MLAGVQQTVDKEDDFLMVVAVPHKAVMTHDYISRDVVFDEQVFPFQKSSQNVPHSVPNHSHSTVLLPLVTSKLPHIDKDPATTSIPPSLARDEIQLSNYNTNPMTNNVPLYSESTDAQDGATSQQHAVDHQPMKTRLQNTFESQGSSMMPLFNIRQIGEHSQQ